MSRKLVDDASPEVLETMEAAANVYEDDTITPDGGKLIVGQGYASNKISHRRSRAQVLHKGCHVIWSRSLSIGWPYGGCDRLVLRVARQPIYLFNAIFGPLLTESIKARGNIQS